MRPRDAAAGLLALLVSLAPVERPGAFEVTLELRDEAGAPLASAAPAAAVRLLIEVRDPLTGWPPAVPPRAWLAAPRTAEEPCALAAARLVQRGADPIRERALDGYRILLFGPSGELALLDPRFRLASARLQGALRLPATPTTALLDPRRAVLWAALPETGLARVDLTGAGRFELLPIAAALALALLPDGKVAIATADGRLVILDPEGHERARTDLPGPARTLLADPIGGRIWAGGPSGLQLIEPADAFALRTILAEPVRALLLLPEKRLLLAAGEDALASLDVDELALLARTPLAAPVDRLAADREERIVLATSRAAGVVTLLDATTGRAIGALAPEDGIEEIALSAGQAYLAPAGSARIGLLPLAEVEPGRLPPLALLAAGTAPRGPAGSLPRLAASPDGRSALILAPAERRVFLHGEGAMLAPSSALPVPFPDASGLLVQPLGPVAVGPGRFELATTLPAAARELVLVFTDPPEARCLPLPITSAAAEPAAPEGPRLRLRPPADRPRAGRPTSFALEIEGAEAVPGEPEFLALSPATGWFARGPARASGEGRFAIELTFPSAGAYELLLRVPGLGLDFARAPSLSVEVEAR
jgi:hypothetical protein